jgi:hypothetical protein
MTQFFDFGRLYIELAMNLLAYSLKFGAIMRANFF